MRDFPVFTTENGVGSLVLKEIPYRKVAYITIQDSLFPEAFLAECVDFCRAVGAERIYACGHEYLKAYPMHTKVIQMCGSVSSLEETDACLFPVTDMTLDRWREIYNTRMKLVDNASYMSEQTARELLEGGDGYFIHRSGELLGIGKASGNRIDCIASVKPGSGREILCALALGLLSDPLVLDVATTNTKAIQLYTSMGFIPTKEISTWYKII